MVSIRAGRLRLLSVRSIPGGHAPEAIRLVSAHPAMGRSQERRPVMHQSAPSDHTTDPTTGPAQLPTPSEAFCLELPLHAVAPRAPRPRRKPPFSLGGPLREN